MRYALCVAERFINDLSPPSVDILVIDHIRVTYRINENTQFQPLSTRFWLYGVRRRFFETKPSMHQEAVHLVYRTCEHAL